MDILLLDDDVAMPTGLTIGLRTWREFFRPRLADVIRLARQVNPDLLIFYHSDGNFTAIVPDLVEIGVNVINPLQPDCMDALQIKRQFGDRLALWGTVGSAWLWDRGRRADPGGSKLRIETLGPDGLLLASGLRSGLRAVRQRGGFREAAANSAPAELADTRVIPQTAILVYTQLVPELIAFRRTSLPMNGSSTPTLGILVGGGPAPGINGVINAATLEAINNGMQVMGIYDGFKCLMTGDITATSSTINDVSRIHDQGGSILRTSRANPTKGKTTCACASTCCSMRDHRAHRDRRRRHLLTRAPRHRGAQDGPGTAVGHIPKTIDNDLPLPHGIPTFGYETARQLGTTLVLNLMEDA